jgi:DNA polymerase-3 subunit epsilon
VNTVTTSTVPWHAARLVAVDLEGSGAQDRDQEQILEIAAIRLLGGRPEMATAFTTLIDPQRTIPARRWISPGLAGTALLGQPTLDAVRRDLLARLTGTYLVGHNVRVDWRLLRQQLPELTVAGLVDTQRLAKAASIPGKHTLTALLDHLQLTAKVTASAAGSRPHRALWDTTGAALLLTALIDRHFSTPPTLRQLLDAAEVPTTPATSPAPVTQTSEPPAQETLFG